MFRQRRNQEMFFQEKFMITKKQIYIILSIAVLLTVGLAVSKIKKPEVNLSTSQAAGESVITENDITYLGTMRMPQSGVDTVGAYGGLTGRRVNGQLRLFLYSSGFSGNRLYELAPTTTFNTDYQQAPRMQLITDWGNIFNGRIGDYDSQGNVNWFGYLLQAGLEWNEQNQLLYWTYYDSYNSTLIPHWNLGATRLDNPQTGQSTAFGPWRTRQVDGDGVSWIGAYKCAYLTTLLNGKMGCEGAYFVSKAAPWGPQLYGGADWPTQSTPTGYNAPNILMPERYLSYYDMIGRIDGIRGTYTPPLRSFRRPGPVGGYVWNSTPNSPAVEIDPLKYNNQGSWTWRDSVADMEWIDTGTKKGVVWMATLAGSPNPGPTCGTGHVWYRNTGVGTEFDMYGCPSPVDIAGPVTDAAYPAFIIYNPATLDSIKAGQMVDYTAEPTSVVNLEDRYNIKTAVITSLAAKSITGSYYDPTTRYLYVLAPSSDTSRVGPNFPEALIHVFAIDYQGPLPPPAPSPSPSPTPTPSPTPSPSPSPSPAPAPVPAPLPSPNPALPLTVPATDNFDRADATSLGSNWTQIGGANGISRNKVRTNASGFQSDVAYWNANSFNADQYAQITITNPQYAA